MFVEIGQLPLCTINVASDAWEMPELFQSILARGFSDRGRRIIDSYGGPIGWAPNEVD
jgi:hypothetical protein